MRSTAGATQEQVRLRGIDFTYYTWGDPSSPPLVLLHGLTGFARIWEHMAPALAQRYFVVAPDQRGHGDTSAGDTYATADFVADLEALAAHWGLSRFALAGLSMGGHNAMCFAAKHPAQVSALVVIDIPPAIDRTTAPNWQIISRLAETGHHTYATKDEAFAEARLGNTTAPDDKLWHRTEVNLRTVDGGYMLKYDPRAPAGWQPADLTDELPRIACPVLLVRGELTIVLPREKATEMLQLFRDGEMVEIAGSGHSVPTDQPEKLLPVMLQWLERRSGGAATK